jgi:hypothetical protein
VPEVSAAPVPPMDVGRLAEAAVAEPRRAGGAAAKPLRRITDRPMPGSPAITARKARAARAGWAASRCAVTVGRAAVVAVAAAATTAAVVAVAAAVARTAVPAAALAADHHTLSLERGALKIEREPRPQVAAKS